MLTQTGKELADVGRSLSWQAFEAFVHHANVGSALAKELNPDVSEWTTVYKTNVILADIFDVLSAINANLCAVGSGKKPKKPPTYPRKKQKPKKQMTIAEMREAIDRKRAERNARND